MHPNRASAAPGTLATAPISTLALPALQLDTAFPALLFGSLRDETGEADGHADVDCCPACGTQVEADRPCCEDCSRPASRRK